MNKAELIDKVQSQGNHSRACVEEIINSTFKAIQDEVAVGNSVQLTGFGTFAVAERAARQGRNPKTGEAIDIPATKVPKFKAGTAFKAAVK